MEKDKSRERDREREKENKRESKKEKRKKDQKFRAARLCMLWVKFPKRRLLVKMWPSSSAKKATGAEEVFILDSGTDIASVTLGDTTAVKTKILIRKGEEIWKKATWTSAQLPHPWRRRKPSAFPLLHLALLNIPLPPMGSMLAQADKLPMTDKRVCQPPKKGQSPALQD